MKYLIGRRYRITTRDGEVFVAEYTGGGGFFTPVRRGYLRPEPDVHERQVVEAVDEGPSS